MKVCRICEVEKPLSAFSFHRKKGIYYARCRSCCIDIRARQESDRTVTCYKAPPYSTLDDARLMTLIAIGVPLKPAAILIGRSRMSAQLRLVRLRQLYAPLLAVTPSPWTGVRIAALREMIGIKGYSRSQAARRLGVTTNAVISATYRHLPELCNKRVVDAFVQRRA